MMFFTSRHLPVHSLLPIIVALFLTGCGREPDAAKTGGGGKGGKSGKGGGAAPVLVTEVRKQKVPLVIEAIGAVEPVRMTSVRSQVTGILEKIAFQEGQDVKEGDVLFQIDARPFKGSLNSALADLQKAKVQFENARSQVTRYQSLTAEQMISKEQFQKIQDDARTAEAEMQAAESRVSNARLQLEFSTIRAPFSGRTGNLNADEGDIVRANDPGALVTINQINPIYVSFGVPQQYLAAINRYRSERPLPVKVLPPGPGEEPTVGQLSFVDNVVDSTTGTIKLKGMFRNDDERLWPGQFASVTVTLAEPEVLAVSASAVQNSQTGQHVYVVTADRIAELRPVKIERTHLGLAVVSSGLQEGETVVVEGQLRVIPGRSVEIKTPTSEARPGDRSKGKKKDKAQSKEKTAT